MRFDTSQQMRLGQHMKLAPRMIQSMEILQLPMLALQERIEQELESNVALEQVEPGDGSDTPEFEGSAETVTAPEKTEGERELVVGDDSKDDFERLSDLETSYGDALDNEFASQTYSKSRMAGERDRKMDAMANLVSRGESLTEQILHQWTFAEVDPTVAELGRRIIAHIDRDGLIGTDLETIRDQGPVIDGAPVTIEMLERALREVQFWIDPAGLAARDVKECLLLQVDALSAEPDADDWTDARLLMDEYFDDLLQNRLPQIARKTGLSMEQIQHAMEQMKLLKLHPGRDLVDEDVPPIIPDVMVEYDEDNDELIATLSRGHLPALRVSAKYQDMARDRTQDKPTREFVGNSVRNASWLIDSINQRANTLLRVVNVVLARQRDYFEKGEQYLKSLPMIEVADQLGIHVGTVSRAVAGKWMQTPRGMIALRRFFSGGTETDSGRDMSWEAIKATLQEIVDGEEKTKPFSDEALAAELKKKGIEIARRTVVKYRQQLDIPPARRRKIFT